MEKKVHGIFKSLPKWLEYMIAGILVVALVIFTVRMVTGLWETLLYGDASTAFSEFLSGAFSLIIGVEFIKMILKPTAENMLEVIMFTIARFLVVEHSSMITCLLGIAALAALFFIRKFLFCEIVQPQGQPRQAESPDIKKASIRNLFDFFRTQKEPEQNTENQEDANPN